MPTSSSSPPGPVDTPEGALPERLQPPPVRRSRWFAVAVAVPLVALASLLVWGTFRTGGRSGGIFVNNNFGEVSIAARPAPDFSFETFDGRSLSLSDLRDKVVMIDFWASWCPPCRREAPELEAVYKEYSSKGVEFVGIDIWDDETDARAFLKRYGVTYPNGLDVGGVITIDYGVTGIPEKYFIDQSGQLLRKFVGPVDAHALRSLLDGLLADAKTAVGKDS